MKLIIDIPEDLYKENIRGTASDIQREKIIKCVKNGTLLPKGHGDLIDRDELLNTLEKLEWIRTNCSVDEDNTNVLEDIIGEVLPIIEADDEGVRELKADKSNKNKGIERG